MGVKAKTFFQAASLNFPLQDMRTSQNPTREFYSLTLWLYHALSDHFLMFSDARATLDYLCNHIE
jgi:hypothetical protein